MGKNKYGMGNKFEHISAGEQLLEPTEVRERFRAHGKSISAWAVANGFSPALVYAVLKRGRKCLRGQSHAIAVALKLKQAPDRPAP